ncbi:uncharacterized protein SETTUDRAFT_38668 [Exserohilum turcica Et28A]|uniref:Uncharacterized protein n=1 Tax=Exserohilum turcicum (strain 28A) TaxID=671987 RepID=R0KHE5_EXST2|nr:uncharacterized protein SETTUDRAFT_38668 [Exserohilum turcica Et28A]EOA88629.1 hypothetical protein SETTUDRAFT_38668 [Exserohilum turcica Et28A]
MQDEGAVQRASSYSQPGEGDCGQRGGLEVEVEEVVVMAQTRCVAEERRGGGGGGGGRRGARGLRGLCVERRDVFLLEMRLLGPGRGMGSAAKFGVRFQLGYAKSRQGCTEKGCRDETCCCCCCHGGQASDDDDDAGDDDDDAGGGATWKDDAAAAAAAVEAGRNSFRGRGQPMPWSSLSQAGVQCARVRQGRVRDDAAAQSGRSFCVAGCRYASLRHSPRMDRRCRALCTGRRVSPPPRRPHVRPLPSALAFAPRPRGLSNASARPEARDVFAVSSTVALVATTSLQPTAYSLQYTRTHTHTHTHAASPHAARPSPTSHSPYRRRLGKSLSTLVTWVIHGLLSLR